MKNEKCDQVEKKRILQELYTNGCSKCGSYKELVYHHVIPTDKRLGIPATIATASNEYIIKELNKCVLLCGKCHNKLGHEVKKRCVNF